MLIHLLTCYVNDKINVKFILYNFHSLKSLLETKVGIGINCNSPHLNVYETSWKSRTFVLVCLFVCLFVCLVVFNATFNNISVISRRSFFLVEETGVPRENRRTVASH